MNSLEEFLRQRADEEIPLDRDYPESRFYAEDENPGAINNDAWLENSTSYIWKVGVLAQVDSNKSDYAWLFIGHERKPGHFDFVGTLYWRDGENDDIGRCLPRYLRCARNLAHPVFHD